MGSEGSIDAAKAGTGRITADACIDHMVTITFGVQFLLQQGDPALFPVDAVGAAQAVSKHQDAGGTISPDASHRQCYQQE